VSGVEEDALSGFYFKQSCEAGAIPTGLIARRESALP
jgi:hypothetical protein